jgi:hypothetical protein
MRSIKHPLAQGQLNEIRPDLHPDVLEQAMRQTDADADDFEFRHRGMENL